MQLNRLIGRYGGHEAGPLVIAIGAVHGNEPAGVRALEEVFQMLEREPLSNPGFGFKGQLVGLIGNLRAFELHQRFIQQDLNRMWQPETVEKVLALPASKRVAEEHELVELIAAIRSEIADSGANNVVLLDLHTTSADGGVFTIPLEGNPLSMELAGQLFAPVVLGLLKGLGGTLMHYAAARQFEAGLQPLSMTCVAFEAGCHDDPASVSRSISAVVSCLRALGCVAAADVDSHHDEVLKKDVRGLPPVVSIRFVHHLQPDDHFAMRPGYVNFQTITAGEHLADDKHGPVYAPYSGYILMPLYQKKGADGFFVVSG